MKKLCYEESAEREFPDFLKCKQKSRFFPGYVRA